MNPRSYPQTGDRSIGRGSNMAKRSARAIPQRMARALTRRKLPKASCGKSCELPLGVKSLAERRCYGTGCFLVREFCRFLFVQQEVAKVGETFVEFRLLQKGASFNLEAVEEQIF